MWATLRTLLQPAAPVDDSRWVVLDVESSGLDPHRDRLLAIAAVAVLFDGARARIDLGDSFEVVLRQAEEVAVVDKPNILLHGIGVGAQCAGMPAREALRAFAEFAQASPLIGFHVGFDQTLIERGFAAARLDRPRCSWLDLAPLAAVLNPGVKAQTLDQWMAHFGIHCAVRHQAAADTLATAELLLKLWPKACTQMKQPGFAAACKLVASSRWLPR